MWVIEANVLFIPNFDARNVRINGEQAVMVLAEEDETRMKRAGLL